jgi:hypothetical protein
MTGRAVRLALRGAVLLAVLLCPSSAVAALPPLEHLQPGLPGDVHQEVPVTVVFVGIEPGDGATRIDTERLLAPQLRSHAIGERTTRFYEREGFADGLEPAAIGLTYDFDYRTVFAGDGFEDAFFGFLRSIAIGPIAGGTVFQQAYAAHPLAAEAIPASFTVDATAAEHWLAAASGPLLGVDTTRPTIFVVNWHGRPDFVFHTYGFLGQRPHTAFPFGFTHAGQMVAWGGSPADVPYGALGRDARVWFYDVSAGPDYGTANWLLGPGDVDGDGVTDHRIAPIWEYGTDHWYRPFDDITGDLAKLVRFVAVDTLFAASPIYDPALSEPLLVDDVELDLNIFSAWTGRVPLSSLLLGPVQPALARLDPTRRFTVDSSVAPLDGPLAAAFDCQQSAYGPQPRSCYGNAPPRFEEDDLSIFTGPFYDLDRYFARHGHQYLDAVRYELPLAVFDLPDERAPRNLLAGLASSRPPNHQGWTYAWLTPSLRQLLARTDAGVVSHEVGHHLGLSHLHDGYDPIVDDDFTSTGPFFFTFTGAEAHSGMSYIPNTDEFGQFDRDHIARWLLAARLDNANRILGDVDRSPRASQAAAAALAADASAGEAVAALDAWQLPAASAAAAAAYRHALAAAAAAGVQVEPYSAAADGVLNGVGVLEAATDPRQLGLPLPRGATDAALGARYGP